MWSAMFSKLRSRYTMLPKEDVDETTQSAHEEHATDHHESLFDDLRSETKAWWHRDR